MSTDEDRLAALEAEVATLRDEVAELRTRSLPTMLTVEQVAKMSGISIRSVDYARAAGKLRGHPLPLASTSATGTKRRWLFHRDDVLAWQLGRRPVPANELPGMPRMLVQRRNGDNGNPLNPPKRDTWRSV